eukprot:scaffold2499_cov125-Cylindrotheca_fusiformis.AAC.15
MGAANVSAHSSKGQQGSDRLAALCRDLSILLLASHHRSDPNVHQRRRHLKLLLQLNEMIPDVRNDLQKGFIGTNSGL